MAETKDTTNSVSVKPIIFSAPMVRALFEGRKTQTRRVMKMPACGSGVYIHPSYGLMNCMGGSVPNAPYNVGGLLWVREELERARGEAVGYPSDCAWLPNTPWSWKNETLPAMFMPRWASRLTLRVTNIRAERLQDISEDDARAEGANFHDGDPDEYGMCRRLRVEAKDDFRHIWEALYDKNNPKAWHRNPWVWVYEFEVIRQNVGEVA